MMRVVVASTNPVKVSAAQRGFARMFPNEQLLAEGVGAASDVSAQPMTDEEALRGALNRARHAREDAPSADYWVGVEGGVFEHEGLLEAFAWIVVTGGTRIGRARTATFTLPPAIAELVRQGVELGHADDLVFGRSDSKRTNGAVGLLTADVIDRTAYYEHAVVLALIPFRNATLFERT